MMTGCFHVGDRRPRNSSCPLPKTATANAHLSAITVSARGGQGVANIEISERNGKVMAGFAVVEQDQLMLVTNEADHPD